jgi:hypothetical protein
MSSKPFLKSGAAYPDTSILQRKGVAAGLGEDLGNNISNRFCSYSFHSFL